MNEPKIKPLAILFAVGIGLVIMLIAPLLGAATQEQLALTQSEKILNMIGPHGIFAIIGSIFLVRTIRVLWYLDKQKSFVANCLVSGLVGSGAVYFFVDVHDPRSIMGGAFMTIIGSMVAYELLKFFLGVAFEKTGSELFRIAFFFLSPKPIKTKKNGVKEEIPPNPTLTQFFDKTRLDK